MNELKTATDLVNNSPEKTAEKYQSTFNIPVNILINSLKNTILEVIDNKAAKSICNIYLKEIEFGTQLDDGFFY
jgi:hypothetical protein